MMREVLGCKKNVNNKKAAELEPVSRQACSTAFSYKFGWLGKKDSNLRMLESKSSALTNLATPQLVCDPTPQWMFG
jgi:hypothetical protein